MPISTTEILAREILDKIPLGSELDHASYSCRLMVKQVFTAKYSAALTLDQVHRIAEALTEVTWDRFLINVALRECRRYHVLRQRRDRGRDLWEINF